MQAVFSGVANAAITADQLDAPVSYEGLAAIGSGLGSAGFVVYDDTACMVEVARELVAVPLRGELRAVPQLQVRQRRDHPHCSMASRPATAPTATSR